MPALITIAIPCYNAGQSIGAAIRSALEQEWPDTEVIVVDDGSSDRSVEQVRAFGDRVQLLAGAHRGGNAARNTALHAARGEWVQFLDADDFLEPQKLTQQLREADGGAAADVIYSPVWVETTGAERTDRSATTIDRGLDLFAQWIAWQLPQTGGALWRRTSLLALGGWKEGQPCCQEHELYLRALEAGLRFVFAPTPHAVYRVWSDDTLCRKDPRLVVRVRTALIDDLREWMSARNLWTNQHARTAGRACFEMARTLAKYDLDEAIAYHDERKARQLIQPDGPAAPRGYRVAYRTLGFAAAEKLAAGKRKALVSRA
ncbi:MAG TPA: glycosyltransferase family 2 protein [Chthoniobacteraceae bacterium]|nr:glycosyltransferase family 2 protein [Chthoniobacteraceae bacterium]